MNALTHNEYKRTSKDYRGIVDGVPYIMHLNENQATEYAPVILLENEGQIIVTNEFDIQVHYTNDLSIARYTNMENGKQVIVSMTKNCSFKKIIRDLR